MAPAGWYVDSAGATRWWDGVRWTEHVAGPEGELHAAPRPAPDPWSESGGYRTDPFAASSSGWAAPDGWTTWPGQETVGRSDRRGHLKTWIAAGVIGAVLLSAAGIAAARTHHPATQQSGAAAASSKDQGTVVFSDSFHDPGSGWTTKPLPSGTTFAYDNGSYAIVAKLDLHHFAYSPFEGPLQQMSVAVTASQDLVAPDGAGFGVSCLRGTGAAAVRYEFLDEAGFGWYVEEGSGVLSTSVGPTILAHGSTPVMIGRRSITVTGRCITSSNGQTTKLEMFIDNTQVAEYTSTTPAPGDGWVSALVVASRDQAASMVRVTHFEVRDLAH